MRPRSDDAEICRPLLDGDGQVIASVRGPRPLSPAGDAAMRALVAAATAMFDADPAREEMEARQAASRERNRARLARLRGEDGAMT